MVSVWPLAVSPLVGLPNETVGSFPANRFIIGTHAIVGGAPKTCSVNVKRLSLHTSLDRELLGSKGKARRQSIGGQPPVPNPMSFPLDPNSYRAIVDFSMKPPKKSATHIGSATHLLSKLFGAPHQI